MSTPLNDAYYRSYHLPWEGDPLSQQRFRKILLALLSLFLLFGILFPLLPTPQETAEETAVPERLARVMIETRPKPPPPKPVARPKTEHPRLAAITPRPTPQEQAHRKAQRQLNQIKDELADLREAMSLSGMASTKLSGAVLADPHSGLAERSLLTSRLASGSGGIGINSAPVSRSFGSAAGRLGSHATGRVTSTITGLNARGGPTRTGSSGMAGRSREEIETVFDRNKGAIYALYDRALRENPQLQGKLVLEFTIAPSGEVTMCRVLSTDLNDKELEDKIVARVRLFRFAPRNVAPVTTTKPIDFFPA